MGDRAITASDFFAENYNDQQWKKIPTGSEQPLNWRWLNWPSPPVELWSFSNKTTWHFSSPPKLDALEANANATTRARLAPRELLVFDRVKVECLFNPHQPIMEGNIVSPCKILISGSKETAEMVVQDREFMKKVASEMARNAYERVCVEPKPMLAEEVFDRHFFLVLMSAFDMLVRMLAKQEDAATWYFECKDILLLHPNEREFSVASVNTAAFSVGGAAGAAGAAGGAAGAAGAAGGAAAGAASLHRQDKGKAPIGPEHNESEHEQQREQEQHRPEKQVGDTVLTWKTDENGKICHTLDSDLMTYTENEGMWYLQLHNIRVPRLD